MSTTPAPSSDSALEKHLVARVHRVLQQLGDRTTFTDFADLTRHVSAFLLATFQIVTRRTLPNVNRAPSKPEHHRHNAQLFLDALRQHMGITLPGVDADLICQGDRDAVLQCIEVIEFLQRKRLRAGTSAVLGASANASDVGGEVADVESLQSWNDVLAGLQLPSVDTFQELRENASSVFTLATEAIVKKRLPNIVRRPLLKQHYIDNARVSLEALSRHLGMAGALLIAPEQIANGDPIALRHCATLLDQARNVRSSPRATTSQDEGANGAPSAHLSKGAPARKQEPIPSSAPDSPGRKRREVLYNDLLMRQVRAIGRKQEIELDRWRLHLLKVSAVELRRDQAWRHKVQTDICRNTTIMKKVRSDIQQYQIRKVFKEALKLERDYMRQQHAAFKARRQELERQWLNKKMSIEGFFRDKYEMLSAGIESDRARRQFQEMDLRRALRRLEKELKDERQKGLEGLRLKLAQEDRQVVLGVTPDKILDRLLKMRVH
ncbi:Calponin-homology (CH) domain-containing protein [Plasmodiophora brassicae]